MRDDFFAGLTPEDVAAVEAASGTREVPIDHRICLSKLLRQMREAAKPLPPGLLQRANDLYKTDDCEIDASAAISRSDGGVWIQGWLFVHDDELVGDDAGRGANGQLIGGEEHARRVVKELEKIFDGWKGVEDAPPVVLTTASNGVIQIAIGNYTVWDSEGSSLDELDAKTLYADYREEIRAQAAVLRLVPSEDAE